MNSQIQWEKSFLENTCLWGDDLGEALEKQADVPQSTAPYLAVYPEGEEESLVEADMALHNQLWVLKASHSS